jgi:hypothetical protein
MARGWAQWAQRWERRLGCWLAWGRGSVSLLGRVWAQARPMARVEQQRLVARVVMAGAARGLVWEWVRVRAGVELVQAEEALGRVVVERVLAVAVLALEVAALALEVVERVLAVAVLALEVVERVLEVVERVLEVVERVLEAVAQVLAWAVALVQGLAREQVLERAQEQEQEQERVRALAQARGWAWRPRWVLRARGSACRAQRRPRVRA